ncbi:MAG: peroxiredoxin-like family protein [Verrucomicrobiales bacterium]|nr:peroxiredoxin-like family protein [Verrucomicrobiales bacterium]
MRTFLLLLALSFSSPLLQAETPFLQSEIDIVKAKNRAKASPEKLVAYADGIEAVRKAAVVDSAKTVDDKAPDFTLPTVNGSSLTLSEELKKGPVVLTWYRGRWCPYCNIQLAAYQKILPQIEELGAQLIAVSPELPDKSLSTTEKNNLRFTVLSDANLKVADEYGLIFKLTPEVERLYGQFFDIREFNGTEAVANELPLAATYVIGQDGVIRWAFLEADYTMRAEPRDILKALDALE